jgi:hypothetical protein
MAQPINLKHTSDLVMDFRHQLLKRREHLYDLQDRLPENIEESFIQIIDDEIDRIQNILKLISKGKI